MNYELSLLLIESPNSKIKILEKDFYRPFMQASAAHIWQN
jgi:hypothetical protein